MSEHTLSIKLRIRLIERISEVDLPGFLFEQFDQVFAELTYFKLMNLDENINDFVEYLQGLSVTYTQDVRDISCPTKHAYATHLYSSYITDALHEEKWKPTCGLRDLLKIKQRYLVMALLSSKEYMYRKPKKTLLTAPQKAIAPVSPEIIVE